MVQINADEISKSFNGELTIFRKFSLRIRSNECVCFFGPSGCGKTTFLNLLAGLIQPDSGSITFKNDKNEIIVPTAGYVFQQPRLLPWLTIKKNITIVLGGINSKNSSILVKRMLKLVKLPIDGKRYPDEMSGGELQRVALARALIVKPHVLFLDEPFSHLDEVTAAQLRWDLLKVFQKIKITTVFTTHNPLEAIYLADRVVVLSEKKPTVIKRIIDTHMTGRERKDLYRRFIFEKSVKRIMHKLLG